MAEISPLVTGLSNKGMVGLPTEVEKEVRADLGSRFGGGQRKMSSIYQISDVQ